jgi:hypothetical protein
MSVNRYLKKWIDYLRSIAAADSQSEAKKEAEERGAKARGELKQIFEIREIQRKYLSSQSTTDGVATLYEWADGWSKPTDTREDLITKPITFFDDVGIVFHFVYWPQYVSGKIANNLDTWSPGQEDRTLDPIERDIIAYSQRNLSIRPFQSCLYTGDNAGTRFGSTAPGSLSEVTFAKILFPASVVYRGESKDFGLVLRPDNKEREFECYFTRAFTRFRNGAVVFHLGFKTLEPAHVTETPLNDCKITEFELTQLVKMWEAGEGYDPSLVKFRIEQGPSLNIEELAKDQFNLICKTPRLKESISETDVQRTAVIIPDDFKLIRDAGKGISNDFSNQKPKPSPEEKSARLVLLGGTIQTMDKSIHKHLSAFLRIGEPRKRKKDRKKGPPKEGKSIVVGRSLTAIGTGLLDVQNLDDDEMEQSIEFVSDTGSGRQVLINKGTVLCVDMEDRTYSTHASRLGCSPYLWLPHTVAIYNNFVLHAAEESFRIAQNGKKESDYQATEIRLRQLIQEDQIKGVFHYPSERNLLVNSSRNRGLDEQLKSAESRLGGVNGALDELRANRERVLQWILEIGVGLLAALQLLSGYDKLRDLSTAHIGHYIGSSLAFIVIAILILCYYYTRAQKRHAPVKMDKRSFLIHFIMLVGIIALILSLIYYWASSLPKPDDSSADTVAIQQIVSNQNFSSETATSPKLVIQLTKNSICDCLSAMGKWLRSIEVVPQKGQPQTTTNQNTTIMISDSFKIEININHQTRSRLESQKPIKGIRRATCSP